jgi:hypothetical protein
MAGDWRHQLKQAAWWHSVGRAATFALAAVAGATAVHHGRTDFDVMVPIASSIGGWAMSLVMWPPRQPR